MIGFSWSWDFHESDSSTVACFCSCRWNLPRFWDCQNWGHCLRVFLSLFWFRIVSLSLFFSFPFPLNCISFLLLCHCSKNKPDCSKIMTIFHLIHVCDPKTDVFFASVSMFFIYGKLKMICRLRRPVSTKFGNANWTYDKANHKSTQ